MTDISIHTTPFQTEDRSWLASAQGTKSPESGTLDVSAFTAGTHYPNGFFPSGLGVTKLTSGLYGPYTGSADAVQTIQVDATGGTFTMTYEGATTAAVAFNATAQAVHDALSLLNSIESGDIVVTGGPGNAGHTTPYVVTFSGPNVEGTPVGAITTNAASLTGGAATAAVVQTTVGGAGTEQLTIDGLVLSSVKVPSLTDNTIDVGFALIVPPFKIRLANLPSGNGLDAKAKADLVARGARLF